MLRLIYEPEEPVMSRTFPSLRVSPLFVLGCLAVLIAVASATALRKAS